MKGEGEDEGGGVGGKERGKGSSKMGKRKEGRFKKENLEIGE